MQVGQKEIFITFRVEKSNYFRREGADIHTDAYISLSQAALGGSIRLEGIYEEQTVDIPAGTGSHTRIRLNGKGLRKVNSYGYGDHYVHIRVKVPVRLSAKQKALILAYAELEEDTPGTVNGITYTKDGKCIFFFGHPPSEDGCVDGLPGLSLFLDVGKQVRMDTWESTSRRTESESTESNQVPPTAETVHSSDQQPSGLLSRIKKALFG